MAKSPNPKGSKCPVESQAVLVLTIVDKELLVQSWGNGDAEKLADAMVAVCRTAFEGQGLPVKRAKQ